MKVKPSASVRRAVGGLLETPPQVPASGGHRQPGCPHLRRTLRRVRSAGFIEAEPSTPAVPPAGTNNRHARVRCAGCVEDEARGDFGRAAGRNSCRVTGCSRSFRPAPRRRRCRPHDCGGNSVARSQRLRSKRRWLKPGSTWWMFAMRRTDRARNRVRRLRSRLSGRADRRSDGCSPSWGKVGG